MRNYELLRKIQKVAQELQVDGPGPIREEGLCRSLTRLLNQVDEVEDVEIEDLSRLEHIRECFNDLGDYADKTLLFELPKIVERALNRCNKDVRKADELDERIMNPEISSGLVRFESDFGKKTTAFIMMQFTKTLAHTRIVQTIKETFAKYGIVALRADDKQYMDDLFPNVKVYMHGCTFGIAVFERINADDFNPNVSLEVGYMLGMGKNILLLKDSTLHALQTDLTGRLYQPFDIQDVEGSIPSVSEKWLNDKGLA